MSLDPYDPKEYCEWDFYTDCIHAKGKDIQDLVDTLKEISYKTFIKTVRWWILAQCFTDYDWKPGPGAVLRMKDDWAVRYSHGIYRGKKVHVVQHSAIEYIFMKNDDVNSLEGWA